VDWSNLRDEITDDVCIAYYIVVGGIADHSQTPLAATWLTMTVALIFLIIETQNDYVRFHGQFSHTTSMNATAIY